MERCSKFLIGLGVGAVLGALAYRFSSSAKAKQLRIKVDHALHRVSGEAEDFFDTAKEKALKAGTKVADKVAEKADDMRSKVHTLSDGVK